MTSTSHPPRSPELPEEPACIARIRAANKCDGILDEHLQYTDALRSAAEAMRAENDSLKQIEDEARRTGPDGYDPIYCIQHLRKRAELTEQKLQQALAAVRDFSVIANLHDKPQSAITIRDGLKVWTKKHAAIIAESEKAKA